MSTLVKMLFAMATAALLLNSGCASTPEISRKNEKTIYKYWDLYCTESPEWEAARTAWLNIGPLERKALVELLILDLLNQSGKQRPDAFGNPQPSWKRSAHELRYLGDDAVGPLLDVLKPMNDGPAVPACIEALAGVARIDRIEETFQKTGGRDHTRFQSRLVRALMKMDDPRALPLLFEILDGEYDWQVRATAASVLRDYKGPRTGEVLKALRIALGDSDPFIVEKARASLVVLEGRGGPR